MKTEIKQLLAQAGINPDKIEEIDCQNWLDAIVAATQKWLTTEDGLIHFSRLLNLRRAKGEWGKEYAIMDTANNRLHPVDRADVWTFQGVVVRGVLIPYADPDRVIRFPYEVEVDEAAKERCECCGMDFHCVIKVKDPSYTDTRYYCNNCIIYHEHPRVQDCAVHNCETCSELECKHHWRRRMKA